MRELLPQYADRHFSPGPPSLLECRLCDANEFRLPEIRERMLALGFNPENLHCRYWERTVVAFLVEAYGYFDDRSRGLGLGVAREELVYIFSTRCGSIVATDLYLPAFRGGAGITCQDVYASSGFEYRRDRLRVVPMDMRALDFDDGSFDFGWSASSIEHLDSIEDQAKALTEVERVLRPGGHAFLTTEWNWLSRNPVYRPGFIALDDVLYPYLLSRVTGLRPVSPLHIHQAYNDGHVFAERWKTATGIETVPCINLFIGGTYITPAAIVLRREATAA